MANINSDNEIERLNTLKEYNILDTLPEKIYNDITMLAAQICQTPISIISFIDHDRQWFKSKIGLDVSETPRDISFCDHAIIKDDIFVVEDTTLDQRFSENPLVKDNPNIRFYAGSPIVAYNGHVIGAVCVIDVVPRKLSENQLESLNALSRQVMIQLEYRKYQDQLLKQQFELKRSNDALKNFANIASHDLQEPLRMISSYTKIISEKYKSEHDTNINKYINFILDGANRMKKLIEDILSYANVQLRDFSNKETDLNRIVESVIFNLSLSIKENNVEIIYTDLPTVNAETTYMIQLFQNLISNSIKFKGQLKPVIKISATKENDKWLLSMKDNGIGINQENSQKIFDMFQRLHSKFEYQGSGIGLANCKKIIELYDGKIWVESEENQGCTFYFTLPDKK